MAAVTLCKMVTPKWLNIISHNTVSLRNLNPDIYKLQQTTCGLASEEGRGQKEPMWSDINSMQGPGHHLKKRNSKRWKWIENEMKATWFVRGRLYQTDQIYPISKVPQHV